MCVCVCVCVCVSEFLIIVMINSRFLKYDGIYSKPIGWLEVSAVCSNCKEGMRFSILNEVAQKIGMCYECGKFQRIILSIDQDGITHRNFIPLRINKVCLRREFFKYYDLLIEW